MLLLLLGRQQLLVVLDADLAPVPVDCVDVLGEVVPVVGDLPGLLQPLLHLLALAPELEVGGVLGDVHVLLVPELTQGYVIGQVFYELPPGCLVLAAHRLSLAQQAVDEGQGEVVQEVPIEGQHPARQRVVLPHAEAEQAGL